MTDASDDLVARLVNSHALQDGGPDACELGAEAAAEITEMRERVAELEAAKWAEKHTDTMNDMVEMGMARDAAEARVAALEAELAAARTVQAAAKVLLDSLKSVPDAYATAKWSAAHTAIMCVSDPWAGFLGAITALAGEPQ